MRSHRGKKSDPTGSKSRARHSDKPSRPVHVPKQSSVKDSKRDSSKEPNWK